jgi:hypothetical protein
MKCIILSHIFIKKDDKEKLELVEFALRHWGEHNPASYIIATGHGLKPRNLEHCVNNNIWQYDIVKKEINYLQNDLLYRGLDLAHKKGFRNVLRSGPDTIHLRKNIFDFAESLSHSDSKLLGSKKTKSDKQDFFYPFLYGNIKLMKEIFNAENSNIEIDFVSSSKLKCIDLYAHWEHLKNKKNAMLSLDLINASEFYL